MPQKINMVISNGNNFPQIQQPQTNNTKLSSLNKPVSLNGAMISRIQGVKSGCGGCGRK